MGRRKSPKFETLVVNAIRRMQDIQGSTPKEISNYISQEYNVSPGDAKRKVQIALRRGLEFGILQRSNGYYSCDPSLLGKPMDDDDVIDRGRRGGRKGSKKKRRGKSSRRKGKGRKRASAGDIINARKKSSENTQASNPERASRESSVSDDASEKQTKNEARLNEKDDHEDNY